MKGVWKAAVLFALPTLMAASSAWAQPPRPRLVVAIVVDQLSADLFEQYRDSFSAGLKRLSSQGVVFASGYQAHAATETCPGASTILTGMHPAHNGIIANSWIDDHARRADKMVYCAEDPDAPVAGDRGYRVSARNLLAKTLGDRLKAVDPASRVVAVAGKDRLAVLLGGQATDQLWFWSGTRFRTAADDGDPPSAVARANARARAAIAAPAPRTIPDSCRDHVDPQPLFPDAAMASSTPRPGDVRGFRASGMLDELTAGLAIDLAQEMKLGRGAATDILAIGLAATDYIGHATGAGSADMCVQMATLDRVIGELTDRLERMGTPFVLMLTADHGAPDAPERSRSHGNMAARRIGMQRVTRAINETIRAKLGVEAGARFISTDNASDIYLDPSATASRPVVAKIAKDALLALPEVEAVLTRDELVRAPKPTLPASQWSIADRAWASFYPTRSGDLVVLFKPYVTPMESPLPGSVAMHGSPWDYDRRIPILFWWPGAAPANPATEIQAVDIMPTLAAMVGLPLPAGATDGTCVALAQSGTWPCDPAR
ncbi:alkaline phosphatase [Sphingobium sp. OAS761]|uniref:alkaline phosphatase family protein n=1 Tax=Sphingobium sp. OAS761 TaxID=2817901 RepID=UPI00209D53E7|nr:alkaline phosphatase family protein [Sphingobium sp. OAS761]MCP1469020.1 alkaline phosphatase [Sphingobium sp. OAS761]